MFVCCFYECVCVLCFQCSHTFFCVSFQFVDRIIYVCIYVCIYIMQKGERLAFILCPRWRRFTIYVSKSSPSADSNISTEFEFWSLRKACMSVVCGWKLKLLVAFKMSVTIISLRLRSKSQQNLKQKSVLLF